VSELLAVLGDVCREVRARADELNLLDSYAGDGDLGVTMSTAANAVLDLLPDVEDMPAHEVLRACGATIASHAPSTAGTLVATALMRAARAASENRGQQAAEVAVLLSAARDGVSERGGADVGSKTMLDALAPAASAAAGAISVQEALALAAEAADTGARSTSSMQPRHGRAGWLAERSLGHEDAGARFVAVALGAAFRSLEKQRGNLHDVQ
jgi:phosphoenolpyruvate---glycerone phosphotransferase subunit DhaL